MNDKTTIFNVKDIRDSLILRTVDEVLDSLDAYGYDSIGQFVGFLTTNDSTYITSHDNARKKIDVFDRTEIIMALLKNYRRKK